MLSSSLRRTLWLRPVPAPGLYDTPARALAACTIHRRAHSSSSKPSDGSSKVEASSQTPAKTSRRRGKDGNGRVVSPKVNQDTAFLNLPSVPSTQHRQPHDVHVASFFSLHRPISVSTSVPPPSNLEAFDAIFSKRTSKMTSDDMIFALSSASEPVEGNTASGDDSLQAVDQSGSLSHFDGEGNQLDLVNMADVKVSLEDATRQFRPFRPPPPPTPTVPQRNTNKSGSLSGSKGTSSYSTVLTIRESTHADGRTTYEAHTTPFVRNEIKPAAAFKTGVSDLHDAPTTYIERLRRNLSIQAMSTKRRRRLKMKKHKWKKRLRLTRSIRQKLDKT